MGVVLDLEEPLVEALEGIAFGEVEDQKGSDRRFVVRPRDRLERLLPRLFRIWFTVSQICILTV